MNKKRPLPPERAAENEALREIWLDRKTKLGLKNSSIAEMAEISDAAVSLYINGVNPLNLEIASVFAMALKVEISDFSPRLGARLKQIIKNSSLINDSEAGDQYELVVSALSHLDRPQLLQVSRKVVDFLEDDEPPRLG